jgi:hypothetical protein
MAGDADMPESLYNTTETGALYTSAGLNNRCNPEKVRRSPV